MTIEQYAAEKGYKGNIEDLLKNTILIKNYEKEYPPMKRLSIEQDISRQGYKDDSPYKNAEELIITSPSGRITMKGVSQPIHATSNLGEEVIMYPNKEYQFQGTEITETPLMQNGGGYYDVVKLDEYNNIIGGINNRMAVNDLPYDGMASTTSKKPTINHMLFNPRFQNGGLFPLSLDNNCTECKQEFQEGGTKTITSKRDFVYSQDELRQIQEQAKKWHIVSGKNCTGGVCIATDNVMPNLGEIGLSKWKENNNYGSGVNHPNQEDYGKSLDAWDIQGAIVKSGGTNYYKSDGSKELSEKEFNELVKTFPVGTVLNYGSLDGKIKDEYEKPYLNNAEGMLAGNHSTVIIGYDEEGTPLMYDNGRVRKADRVAYGLFLNASAPKEYSEYTYENLQSKNLLDKSWKAEPLVIDSTKLEYILTEDGSDKKYTFNKDSTEQFINTLTSQKEDLATSIGIESNEEYDKLSKMATAIAMAETKGGSVSKGSIADYFGLGDSLGMTQINGKIIFSKDENGEYKEPKIVKLLNKYGIKSSRDLLDDDKSAIATMILLKTFKDRANASYEKGKGEGNSRLYRNADSITGLVRGIDNVVIESTGETVNVPNSDKGVEDFNNKKIKGYTAGKDEKGFFIKKDTKGNSELSEEERLAYYWNSPYTLESGDAQGNSSYVKRIMEYYRKLQEN